MRAPMSYTTAAQRCVRRARSSPNRGSLHSAPCGQSLGTTATCRKGAWPPSGRRRAEACLPPTVREGHLFHIVKIHDLILMAVNDGHLGVSQADISDRLLFSPKRWTEKRMLRTQRRFVQPPVPRWFRDGPKYALHECRGVFGNILPWLAGPLIRMPRKPSEIVGGAGGMPAPIA